MKFFHALVLVLFFFWSAPARADLQFAWLSDTHIGDPTGADDLRASVRDINSLSNISFVILSGDVTQFGSREQFLQAKTLLSGLKAPLHVVPGNHDGKWSESGATDFERLWGYEHFVFDADGFAFIGLYQGPIMKMGDGHFSPQDVRWLYQTLKALPANQPIIFVTHYPMNDSIDNWYVVLNELKKFNIQAILVGHGHHNEKMNFEGVPGVMGRSNLRAGHQVGGYTLVGITNGVMTISERDPGSETQPPWDTVRLREHDYAAMTNRWPRPSFAINKKYPGIEEKWRFNTGWTVASSPAVDNGRVFIGDGSGRMRSISLGNGKVQWSFRAGGPIYSTPAVESNLVVFASTDGGIYALRATNGAKKWEYDNDQPIVASPQITNDTVYIGASDGNFRALDLTNGSVLWDYPSVGGFVETRPLIADGEVIFGAWDQHLYALNATNGQLLWKWEGKSPGNLGVMYSPAAFWPVAADQKVFVVAPDRFMTALDLKTGREIWRTDQWQVRESIGLSEDHSRFYVRTMPGLILAFATAGDQPRKLWQLDAHFGYDINSAALVEKDGTLFYGTKNGLLLAIDPTTGHLLWEHRLGVTVLNTVVPVSATEAVVSDVDGRITLVKAAIPQP